MKIVIGVDRNGIIQAAFVLGIETLTDVKNMDDAHLDIKVIGAKSVTIGQQYPALISSD